MKYARQFFCACLALFALGIACAAEPFELKDGDRVAFIGGTFSELESEAGFIETLLTLHFSDRNVSFRNLGWSGDESFRQTRPPKHPKLTHYLDLYKPTVCIINYGMVESFNGEAGLQKFHDGLKAVLETLKPYNARIVFVSPIKHENLGKPYPDPAEHNANLKKYSDSMKSLADTTGARFVNLFDALPTDKGQLTINGIHLKHEGYMQAALAIEKELGLQPKPWRDDFLAFGKKNRVQQLRERIARKNLEYFYRYKPQNYEYVYGSRIGNQKGLDTELNEYDTIIAEMEKGIFAARKLDADIAPLNEVIRKPLTPQDAAFVDPAKEQATFTLPEGYEISLFAANPLIGKPVQMAWDSQNRLWVASTTTYPQVKPGETANDQIIILEDTDGDGKADKSTVFADRLLMPTGFAIGDGGCYVFHNTRVYHLKDTDGDGKADRRDVLLMGFGVEDNHHSAHSFRWDTAGGLHFHQGVFMHSTVETPYGIRQHLKNGDIWSTACIWEFRPESGRLETFLDKSQPPNPWGRYYTRWGYGLYNDSSGNQGVNLILATAGGTSNHINVPGAQGKLAGGDFITGRAMPEEIQGDLLIPLFKENKLLRMKFSDDGAGFAAKQLPPMITSTDRAFRPVEVRMGPDGAAYVADWYNPLIGHMQHHLHDPARDKNQGRIWRITAKNMKPLERPKVAGASIKDVLNLLKAPEDQTRFTARRELCERKKDEVLAAIPEWLKSLDANDKNYDHHRSEALWLCANMNSPEPTLLRALLSAKDPNARAAATAQLRRWAAEIPSAIEMLEVLVQDENPRVRMEAVVTASYFPQARAAEIAAAVLDKATDRYIDQALKQTFTALKPHWQPALEKGELTFGGNVKRLQFALQMAGAKSAAKTLLDLLKSGKVATENRANVITAIAQVGDANNLNELLGLDEKIIDTNQLPALLNALQRAARERNTKPAGDLARVKSLLKSNDEIVRAAALRLAGALNLEDQRGEVTAAAENAQASLDLKRAAFESLADLGGPASVEALKKYAGADQPVAVRYAATAAFARMDAKAGAETAAAVLASDPAGANPSDIFASLLNRNEGAEALNAALKAKAPHEDAARFGLRYINSIGREVPELAATLKFAANIKELADASPEEIKKIMAEAPAKGDAARGEKIFRRADTACLSCHGIGGAGGQAGPDLSSVGTGSQMDYLVEAILLPAKTVKEGFEAGMVITNDGQVINGLLKSDSKDAIVLRDAIRDEITIPRANVKRFKKGGSLMPVGLADTLTRQELLDLVKFLSSLGVKEYSVQQTPVVRRWKMLNPVPDSAAAVDVKDAAKFDALPWTAVYSVTNGTLPSDDIVRAKSKPVAFLRAELDVTTPGKVKLKLNSAKGVTAVVENAPIDLAGDGVLELPRGLKTFTFKVDLAARGNEPLRVDFEDVAGSAGRFQVVNGK